VEKYINFYTYIFVCEMEIKKGKQWESGVRWAGGGGENNFARMVARKKSFCRRRQRRKKERKKEKRSKARVVCVTKGPNDSAGWMAVSQFGLCFSNAQISQASRGQNAFLNHPLNF